MSKTKAEKQAELRKDDFDDLIGSDDQSPIQTGISEIDDLLGPDPTKPAKPKEVKAPRLGKGVMVSFKNQKGERITGPGVLYYVVRANGKLYYKEASQVFYLPEGWTPGNTIPGIKPGDDLL